jgi:hypothetical protein
MAAGAAEAAERAKEAEKGAYEAGKLAGAEAERSAILTILDDEAARLNRGEHEHSAFAAAWVRHASRVVRLWRLGEEFPAKPPKNRLRSWLA